MLLDCHHLASDGSSRNILIEEICSFLEGAGLPAEPNSYIAFAEAQKADATDHKAYYDKLFGGGVTSTALPADLNGEGGSHSEQIQFVSAPDVMARAKALVTAPSALFMAAAFCTRGRWTGFFIGQAVTGIAILIWGMTLRHKDRSLCRFLLIPMKDGTTVLDMTVTPSTQSLSEAISSLRSFLTADGRNSRAVYIAAVCAEEFVANIIRHGHASAIDLAVAVDGDTVTISIHDDGTAFNPVAAFANSGSAPEGKDTEIRIGLGLTLANEFCKDISYKYIFNQNMVTMKIRG